MVATKTDEYLVNWFLYYEAISNPCLDTPKIYVQIVEHTKEETNEEDLGEHLHLVFRPKAKKMGSKQIIQLWIYDIP